MTAPKHIFVIHSKRHSDMPGKRVYVGRPGQWGNPFASKPSRVGEQINLAEWQARPNPWTWLLKHRGSYTIRVSSATLAVDLYLQFLRQMWQQDAFMHNELLILARCYKEQADDLLLVCWCKHSIHDDTPCHGNAIKAAILGIIEKGLV
jgi:hypothetical protein